MSEFANGSLAMYHHPLTGSFSYAGNFTAEDFLAPIDGEEAEDLFILMASGKAYVSRADAATGWLPLVSQHPRRLTPSPTPLPQVNIHTTAFPAGMLRGNLYANLTEWLGA